MHRPAHHIVHDRVGRQLAEVGGVAGSRGRTARRRRQRFGVAVAAVVVVAVAAVLLDKVIKLFSPRHLRCAEIS